MFEDVDQKTLVPYMMMEEAVVVLVAVFPTPLQSDLCLRQKKIAQQPVWAN